MLIHILIHLLIGNLPMKTKKANCGASVPATQKSKPKMMNGGMAVKKPKYGHGGMAAKKK